MTINLSMCFSITKQNLYNTIPTNTELSFQNGSRNVNEGA